MTYKTETSSSRTIRKGEKGFMLVDGLFMSPRAGFEIKKECPNTYAEVIRECINRGWLQPVAYMREDEYMWEELKE